MLSKYSRRIWVQTGKELAHVINHGSRRTGKEEGSSGRADSSGRCGCMKGLCSGARSQGGKGDVGRKRLLSCTMSGKAQFPAGPESRQVIWSTGASHWSWEVSGL